MKKLLIFVFCVLLLVACAKEAKECVFCGEMKTDTKTMSLLGEKYDVCKDCRAELSQLL